MNFVKSFKKCKNYWWCFKKTAKEYYAEAIGDPEEKKEQMETLLGYIMDFEQGYTKACVNGQEIKEFSGSGHCTIEEFLKKFNGREIVIDAKDLVVLIGIYPPQDSDEEYRFDILDYYHPYPLTEENEDLWEEELAKLDGPPM